MGSKPDCTLKQLVEHVGDKPFRFHTVSWTLRVSWESVKRLVSDKRNGFVRTRNGWYRKSNLDVVLAEESLAAYERGDFTTIEVAIADLTPNPQRAENDGGK